MTLFNIRQIHWNQGNNPCALIRKQVFVEEQQVPETLEWDEHDVLSRHFLAETNDGLAVGCARLLPDGHIGRMAVLPLWRGKGIGSLLLQALEAQAKQLGFSKTQLSAQTHAIGFYQRQGYAIVSETYMDAGIPHQTMEKQLP